MSATLRAVTIPLRQTASSAMSASAAGAPDRGGSRSAVTTRSPTASAAARREDPDSTTNHLRQPSAETQRSRAAPEGAARDLHLSLIHISEPTRLRRISYA